MKLTKDQETKLNRIGIRESNKEIAGVRNCTERRACARSRLGITVPKGKSVDDKS